MTKLPARHILRGILRYLKPVSGEATQTTTTNNNNNTSHEILQKFVWSRYRSSSSLPQSAEDLDGNKSSLLFSKQEKLAKDYFNLKQDLHERERLQKLDTGAEVQLSPKEMSRRAAARAGLQLPEIPTDS